MQWVKVPLILFAVLVLVALFRQRQRVEFRAGSRVLALVLVAAAVVSIALPGIPQHVANWLGVARGTDLILYLLVVVFVLTTLGLYFRLRETETEVRTLARTMAIERAVAEGAPGEPVGRAAAADREDVDPGQPGGR